MAKISKDSKDNNSMRKKISDEALLLISEQGFENFSMRKLAARLDITASAIYYYFPSKDAIYLEILIEGFDLLHNNLKMAYDAHENTKEKIKAMLRAYLDFGMNYPHQYSLMFTWILPKAKDYIGREEEAKATIELEKALSTALIAENAFAKIIEAHPTIPLEDIKFHVFRIWSTLHGIVSLYISQTMHYYITSIEETIEGMVEYLTETLFP